MATPAKINRNTGHDLAAIGVRLLDDAHMTWAAAEVESEHTLRAWFDGGAQPHPSGEPGISRSGRPRGGGSARPAAAL